MYLDDYRLKGCPPAIPLADWWHIRHAIDLMRASGRFRSKRLVAYLAELYAVYRRWRILGKSKLSSDRLAREFAMRGRNASRAAWTLVQSTCPDAGRKQHSRWARVMEFADRCGVRAGDFRSFLEASGGVSGCARSAARCRRHGRIPPIYVRSF